MYNPYLAFSCLQAQAFPTYNSNPFLVNPINPLLLAASNSLNQKRPFLYDQTNYLNESDFTPLASQKRFKADNNYGNLLENTQLQRLNPINEQRTKSTILNQQQVITIDDDEPAENSLSNSSSLTETMFSHRQNFNPMALLDFQKCFGINQNPLNAFSLSLLNQLNQAQTQPFSQAFGYQNWNPSEIDRSSKFESVAGQTNLFEPLPANLKSVQKPSKLGEIVTIEDDEEDQSTCQTSQTERDVFSPCFSNAQIKNKASINGASTETAVVEEKTNTVPCYVKLPPFEMSVLNSQKKKGRPVKQVWNPKNIEAEKLEKWMDQISQAVGIEVTHEEKILKTMMGFGMNIESALEKIKRNKAYYKNYFRIKNAGRNY